MLVLIACEYTATVRQAFAAKGHEAVSCDILPTEVPGEDLHYEGDIKDILYDGWDLMIAHPPCTYLASSGLHWNNKIEGRAELTEEALDFVRMLLDAPIDKICLENPVGRIGTAIRKADQYIQPYDFGHNASKKTGLWLKNLPKLEPTLYIPHEYEVDGKKRWANQTPGGQDKTSPSPTRGLDRSRTFQGIADAIAEQWG